MLNPHDIPGVAELEAIAATIHAEASALPESAWVPMPSPGMYRGDWTALLFSVGPWAHEFPTASPAANLAACPTAAAFLVRHADRIGVFGLLRLAPGATLAPHRDHRHDEELRVHIPVSLPAEGEPGWTLHRARLLDIRQLHGGHNPGTTPRITVVADIRTGAPVGPDDVAAWPQPTP